MQDLISLVLCFGFALLSFGYIALCDKLGPDLDV